MRTIALMLEFTPNPNTLKYVANIELLSRGSVSIAKGTPQVSQSPLAEELFLIPGVTHLLIGKDFITLTKDEESDWQTVNQAAKEAIESHLAEGLPVAVAIEGGDRASSSTSDNPRLELLVREFLEKEIRPMVAMDGGDIVLNRVEGGVVFVELQGSCMGCPSSTATLKDGIEARLVKMFPELHAVEAL